MLLFWLMMMSPTRLWRRMPGMMWRMQETTFSFESVDADPFQRRWEVILQQSFPFRVRMMQGLVSWMDSPTLRQMMKKLLLGHHFLLKREKGYVCVWMCVGAGKRTAGNKEETRVIIIRYYYVLLLCE